MQAVKINISTFILVFFQEMCFSWDHFKVQKVKNSSCCCARSFKFKTLNAFKCLGSQVRVKLKNKQRFTKLCDVQFKVNLLFVFGYAAVLLLINQPLLVKWWKLSFPLCCFVKSEASNNKEKLRSHYDFAHSTVLIYKLHFCLVSPLHLPPTFVLRLFLLSDKQ